MFLVVLAVGTAVFSGDFVATGLAFGLALMAIIYVIGPISGGHVNPAVSVAFLIKRKLSLKDFAFYVVAQVVGAIIGGAIIFGMVHAMGDNPTGNMGANYYEPIRNAVGWAIVAGMALEIMLTFVFVLAIIAFVRKDELKKFAPILIGLVLILVHFVGMSITGTSVNPARSLGSAIFGGTDALRQVWLFLVAPMIGGGLAALASMFLFCEKKESATIEQK